LILYQVDKVAHSSLNYSLTIGESMIEEFIKEYRQLRKKYENMPVGDDDIWMCGAMEDLVCRYETELNIQALKELQKPFDPAVNDSIKDMEEEERAFPPDKE